MAALKSDTRVELSFHGRFSFGIDQWAYVPFDVPAGIQRIDVSTSHDQLLAARHRPQRAGSGHLRACGPRTRQRRGLPGLVGWRPSRVHAVRGERDARLPGRPDRTRPLGVGARAGCAQPAGHGLARQDRADAGRAAVVASGSGLPPGRPPRHAPGLVSRRLTHAHSAFRWPAADRRDGFGRHFGRTGFHRLHRPQHQLRQPGLGGNHIRWPGSHRR